MGLKAALHELTVQSNVTASSRRQQADVATQTPPQWRQIRGYSTDEDENEIDVVTWQSAAEGRVQVLTSKRLQPARSCSSGTTVPTQKTAPAVLAAGECAERLGAGDVDGR